MGNDEEGCRKDRGESCFQLEGRLYCHSTTSYVDKAGTDGFCCNGRNDEPANMSEEAHGGCDAGWLQKHSKFEDVLLVH